MIAKDKHFYKTMLFIALPIAAQNLITFLVNLLDTLMISQLGEDSLSGVQLAGQLFFILILISGGIGEGINILIAQYYGKQEMGSIRKIYPIAYRVALFVGFLGFLIGNFFPETFIRFYAKADDVKAIEEGTKYLQIVSLSYIPFILSEVTIRSMRAVKSAYVAMPIYFISFVINASLNYILIFGKLGFPELGVQGAAIGTVCARTTELILASIYLFRIDKKIQLKLVDLRSIDKAIRKKLVTFAAPILCNEIVWVLASTTIALIFAKMGKQYVAANAVSSIMFQLVSMLLFGMGSAASVTIGNVIGKGDPKQAYTYANTFMLISICIGLLSSTLVYHLKDFAITLYNLTPETAIIAQDVITAASLLLFLQSFNIISGMGALRGGGDGKFVLISEITFVWLIAVPFGFLSAFYWKLPVFWIVLLSKGDEILKFLTFGSRILFTKWVKDVTIEEEKT
ncbi:MAG: MATE family efflux transporter [Eubacteriales bacterium]